MELYEGFIGIPSYYFVLYYTIVICSFIYICNKFKNDIIAFSIILLFYSGMFAYFGKNVENTYKIITLCLTVYAGYKWNVFNFRQKQEYWITTFFIIFSISFFISAIINQNYLLLAISQYAKYLIPFFFFFIFKHYSAKTPWKLNRINFLFLTLLLLQIILSIAKFLIFGILESIVGSISYVGGGEAAVIPIIGFIFLWIIKKGKLKQRDWIFFIGLLFIGFVSIKRAIWFMMPIVVFLFMIYIPKKKLQIKYLFFTLLLSPIIFYFGIRLNPTLNKENKIWGSYDYNYALNYASKYSFGEEENGFREVGEGRGGATLLLYNNLLKDNFFELHNFFGYGLDEIYTKDYNNFDTDKFGVNSKGSVTGVFQCFISTGFIGILTFLLYALSLIFYLKNTRIRIVLIGFFCWEYFFYIGMLFRIQALSVFLIYCIIYFNTLNNKKVELKEIRISKP